MQQFHINKKEERLVKLTEQEVINELKTKKLPTFGTKGERYERLKKFYGITSSNNNDTSNLSKQKSKDDYSDPNFIRVPSNKELKPITANSIPAPDLFKGQKSPKVQSERVVPGCAGNNKL